MALRPILIAALVAISFSVKAADDDPRTALNLPDDVKVAFLEEMRSHMLSLDTVVQYLAAGKTKEAGEYARKEMSIGHGRGIGRYMPMEFRQMGWAFHGNAEDFAKITDRLPDKPDAAGWVEMMSGLAAITATCNGCHGAFRVR